MTSGNHLIRRIESARGEPRDRNRWDVYCRVSLQLILFLRRAILLSRTFVRQSVHSLTAVTFGDSLSIAKENFDSYLDALGNKFIAGGDYNAKHTQWGSRLVTATGKNLLKNIISNNLNYLTTYEPTYWSTDTNKFPNLLDFFITKNISPRYVQINSSVEISSNHSPVIATVGSAIIENPPNDLIHNQLTNWYLFREVFNHSTSASISLKTKEDIETAIEYLNTSIINAIRSQHLPILLSANTNIPITY